MIFIKFLVIATVVVICAINLAKQAQVIEKNTRLNVAIIGLLLAFATSLPELASGITSSLIGQSSMAMANVLGSNVFNLMILAGLNIGFYRQIIYQKINNQTNNINLYVIMIYCTLLISIIITHFNNFYSGRVNVSMLIVAGLYFLAFRKLNTSDSSVTDSREHANYDQTKLQRSQVLFFILAIIILFFSIELAKTADQILQATTLNASFIGAIFIGISTSLPELVSSLTLIKTKAYNLAATNLLGSNLFNFLILVIIDVVDQNPILASASSGTIILIGCGLIFSVTTYGAIKLRLTSIRLNLILPVVMIASYLALIIYGS